MKPFKKFELDADMQPWLFPPTGEKIDRRGLLVISRHHISVENVYSQKFDLEEAGFTDEEIKEGLASDESKATKKVRGKRGEVTDFSRASQRRLMKACALWEPVGVQLFLTLTYPKTWPDAEVRKGQFKRFCDALRKAWPLMGGCWKLEYQKRGAPHYHGVFQTGRSVFGSDDLRAFQRWVSKMWGDIVNYTNVRTEVRFPRSEARAKYYLTKEVGKMVQASKAHRAECDTVVEHSGRFWGWHNRSVLQFKGSAYTLPSHVAIMVREAIQSHILNGMVRDKKVYIDAGIGPVFKSNGVPVDMAMLPSFRLYTDGEFAFDDVRDYVLEKYNVDVYDHLTNHPPPR